MLSLHIAHIFFLQAKSFIYISPNIEWVLNRIKEIRHFRRYSKTHSSIGSITIINLITLLFIGLWLTHNTNGDIIETLSLEICTQFQLPLRIVEWRKESNFFQIHEFVVGTCNEKHSDKLEICLNKNSNLSIFVCSSN